MPNQTLQHPAAPTVAPTPSRRFETYKRRAAKGDRNALAFCLGQELLELKIKYNDKNFRRELERFARRIRVIGKRKPEADQLAVMLAIKEGCHEVDEIMEITGFEREEVKDTLDELIKMKKVVCHRVHRVHNGKGAKRKLYYLTTAPPTNQTQPEN